MERSIGMLIYQAISYSLEARDPLPLFSPPLHNSLAQQLIGNRTIIQPLRDAGIDAGIDA